MKLRNSMVGITRGMVIVSVAAYGCDEFPTWLKDVFFRVLRFWELARGLAEDGLPGFADVWVSHRRDDRDWREREHLVAT